MKLKSAALLLKPSIMPSAQLNASSDNDVDDATYSRPTGTQRLLITHDTAGTAGNTFTLAEDSDVPR